jgi:hypothetical protein
VDFISAFQIIPRNISANGCRLQGVVGILSATQVRSVLWAYTDYDSSYVASCRGHSTTCFGKCLSSSGGRRCLIIYSSNFYFVGVYGL